MIDDWVPTWIKNTPYFSDCPKGKTGIWPILLEKAWAKLCGSYFKTESGNASNALMYLTGVYAEQLWNGKVAKQEVWNKYFQAEDRN